MEIKVLSAWKMLIEMSTGHMQVVQRVKRVGGGDLSAQKYLEIFVYKYNRNV